MRGKKAASCFVPVLSALAVQACGAPGTTSVPRITLDATMPGDADGVAPDVTVTTGSMIGPDPAPLACDPSAPASTACPVPPAVCLNSRFAVVYASGHCASGACEWTKLDLDCVTEFGGTCVGGASDGGIVPAYGGPSVVTNGCAVPLRDAGPPDVACDGGAEADVAVCAPPHSVCGGANWLVYFDDGACVSGQCVWRVGVHTCTECNAGACVAIVPTPPPPV